MASLLDFLGLQPTGGDGGLLANFNGAGTSYGDVMGALNNNRNMIAGLGLGLMSGTKYNPYGNVMQGFQQGANADIAQQYRRALIAQHAADRTQSQSNADRSFNEQKRQFDLNYYKPSVVFKENEDGDQVPYLVNPRDPKNPIQPLDPKTMAPVAPGPQASVEAVPFGGEDPSIPANAAFAQAGPSGQAPPDVKRKKDYYKKYATERGEQDAKDATRGEAGGRVLTLIDNLMAKTENPLFNEAAGPMQAEVSNSPMWDPRRLAYEYTKMGPSVKAQGFLREIESDTQAINSELQRAYLSGQGSVTENERLQINKILGQIPAARNKEEAQALLKNAKDIIATAFQRGYGGVPKDVRRETGPGGGTTNSGIKWTVE